MLSDNFKEKLQECLNLSSLRTLESLSAEMKGRIHQDGLKTDGREIGDYSDTFKIRQGDTYIKYKDYRRSRGRQIEKIDLHLEGNLENSLQVGIVGDRYVLGFDSVEQFDLASKHTQHYGKIWGVNDEEMQIARETFSKIYQQCLQKSFKK